MARTVLDQLIAAGKVRRGQLGVAIQPVTPEQAADLGLKEPKGVIIASVTPQGPAARAGLRPGDAIVGFQGEAVTDGNTLRNRIASTPPGTAVKLAILRDRQERQIDVTLGEYEPQRRG
jgi:serine protease Do